MGESFSVLIIDMFQHDPEEDYVIGGFPSVELAREFARRWVRDSVEEQRATNRPREELRRMWHAFGEDASVLGCEPHYAGSHELDFFIEHPATDAERDWREIKRLAGIA
jgi:hypothetical protein